MSSQTVRGLACLGWAVVLSCGLNASAAPMTTTTTVQTETIAPTQTDWGPSTATLAGVNPLSLTKFDPTLGKLDAVNLSLSYTFLHDVTMTFTSPSTITVTGNQNGISVTRPDLTPVLSGPVPDYSVSQTYSGPAFPYTLTVPTHTSAGSLPPVTLTSSADLALFTQSAPSDTLIKLPISAQARSTFTSSSSNGAGGSQVSAGVVVTLSYTYEPKPVPEPSTLATFGLGVGGYLLARRNRRSSAAA